MGKHTKPITSFEELNEEMMVRGLSEGRGMTVRNGCVHEVGKDDTNLLELGGRVAEELE